MISAVNRFIAASQGTESVSIPCKHPNAGETEGVSL
jgi:hypothetical protein